MTISETPLFEDHHRDLENRVAALCRDRLGPLAGSELEDPHSAAVEYVALLGQEGLFDPALGRALEGEAPRPELRSLVIIREALGQVSGLSDAAFGAQVQGMFPIALSGNEDQRAIYLPGMASGQALVGVALLDGEDGPARVKKVDDDTYILNGSKAMVPLAPIADRFVILARHADEPTPRFSAFVVEAGLAEVTEESFVSPLPVGRLVFKDAELDAEARLGGEGQGLVIAQATLDMFRLPTAAACIGIALQALTRGTRELLAKGAGGRRLVDQQGLQWELGEALAQIEAARAVVTQAAWRRDSTNGREVMATSVARHLAQEAAENACQVVADMIGIRGLRSSAPWERLLAEVRAFRLESEFLENARTVIAQGLLQGVERSRI